MLLFGQRPLPGLFLGLLPQRILALNQILRPAPLLLLLPGRRLLRLPLARRFVGHAQLLATAEVRRNRSSGRRERMQDSAAFLPARLFPLHRGRVPIEAEHFVLPD